MYRGRIYELIEGFCVELFVEVVNKNLISMNISKRLVCQIAIILIVIKILQISTYAIIILAFLYMKMNKSLNSHFFIEITVFSTISQPFLDCSDLDKGIDVIVHLFSCRCHQPFYPFFSCKNNQAENDRSSNQDYYYIAIYLEKLHNYCIY